jgi:hypothetical protein
MMRNMMLMPTQESVYSLGLCDFVIFSAGITHVSQKYGWLWYLKLQSIQHYPVQYSKAVYGMTVVGHVTRNLLLNKWSIGVAHANEHLNPLASTSSAPFQSNQLYIPSYIWIFNTRKFIRFVLVYRCLTTLISCILALSCYLYVRTKKTWIKTVTLMYSL